MVLNEYKSFFGSPHKSRSSSMHIRANKIMLISIILMIGINPLIMVSMASYNHISTTGVTGSSSSPAIFNYNGELTSAPYSFQGLEPISASDYTTQFTAQTFTGKMHVMAMASPDNCFEQLEKLILSANSSINISVYTLSSPYLLEALIDRISAGVDVKILLEKSQVNYYEQNYNRWTMKNLTEFSHNGHYAEGKWANSSKRENHPEDTTLFSYQHSKYAIIDGKILVISSGNWGKSSCPKPQDDGDVDGNRDWWFAVYGDSSSDTAAHDLVEYFADVFNYDWSQGYAYNESVDGAGFAQTYDRSGSPSYNPFSAQEFTLSMSITPVLSPDTSLSQILGLINSAESSIYIEEMYIQNGLDDIINALVSKKNAGVDVKVIVSQSGSDNESIYSLLDAGIPVRKSVPNMHATNPNPFDTMHNKGVIVDHKKVLISSINWSPNSIYNNREAGIIVQSNSVAGYYLDLYNYDWDACE
ncbi:MAG: phospholipase D-like domain-containing protein, partial [Promethearchaeota archaeon]